MRTTLTLDDDILEQVKTISRKNKKPFKDLINQILRSGLAAFQGTKTKKYKTKSRPMGLHKGLSIDNISEVLESLEK